MTRNDFFDLADFLENEGAFEIYRDSSAEKSKQVWLTEKQRDAIVNALHYVASSERAQ